MEDNKCDWQFKEESNVSDQVASLFVDSTFSDDDWVKFAREIIQNSLDAHDNDLNPCQPVLVKFSKEFLPLKSIPGGERLKEIIESAIEYVKKENNRSSTLREYEQGLKMLSQETIPCLKISDYNTIGMGGGRDGAWGLMLYDQGKNKKQDRGSGGGFGVGKKATFLVSKVNTVFYSSHSKEDNQTRFAGHSILVNWKDKNGKVMCPEGWYCKINNNIPADSSDEWKRKNQYIEISDENELAKINPFFVRKDSFGTDVIAIAAKFEESTLQRVENQIILATIENFFVAIEKGQLVVSVFDQEINKDTLLEKINSFYSESFKKNFKKESDTLFLGNLNEYYRVMTSTIPEVLPIKDGNGKTYGFIDLYCEASNAKNKKIYCITRKQGMKIKDVYLYDADQPFTAVAIIRDPEDSSLSEDDKINAKLLTVENASHDDFKISEDNNCDPLAKELVESIYSEIKGAILRKTKINVEGETPLDGLEEAISLNGDEKSSLGQNKTTLVQNKKYLKKKEMADPALDFNKGVAIQNIITAPPDPSPVPPPVPKPHIIPAKPGSEFLGTLFYKFKSSPRFFHVGGKYILKFSPEEDVSNANIKISALTVDGGDDIINDFVLEADCNGLPIEISDNVLKNVSLKKDRTKVISIKLKDDFDYALECSIFERKEEING